VTRPPLRIFGKYEVLRRLARGGMGELFLARQHGLADFSRLVVLKSLRPELVEDAEVLALFLAEASTVARLNHPNVVAIHEVGEDRGVYFIAMEHVAGTDLVGLLRASAEAQRRIPLAVAGGLAHGAALGLHHAHTARDEDGRPLGVVHRDVSPHNVMVRLDGIPKIVDFGIASFAGARARRGKLQGKIRYMAPEQLVGGAVTPASDQYALGVVLWELLAARRLSTADDAQTALRERHRGLVPPSTYAPDVPGPLDAVVMTMLSAEPDARFPSLRAGADALRAALDLDVGGLDAEIAAYVEPIAGAQIAERSRVDAPEPVVIPGLLDAPEQRCPRCSAANGLRHAFCVACGAELSPLARRAASRGAIRRAGPRAASAYVASGPPSASAPSVTPDAAWRRAETFVGRVDTVVGPSPPRPDDPRAPDRRDASALATLLRTHTRALDAQLADARAPTIVVVARLTREAVPRLASTLVELDRLVVDALVRAVEPFGAEPLAMSAERVALAFDDDGRPATTARALRLATELAAAATRVGRAVGAPLRAAVAVARVELPDGRRAAPAPRAAEAERHVAAALSTLARGAGVLAPAALLASHAARVETAPGELDGWLRVGRWLDAREARPLVGRRAELLALRATLDAACEGRGVSVLVVGEAGLGRSRLLEATLDQAERLGLVVIGVRAGRGQPWLPGEVIRTLVRRALDHAVPASPSLPTLRARLEALALDPALAAASAVALEARPVDPSAAEAAGGAALMMRALEAITAVVPVCLAVDDLPLVDTVNRADLERLARAAPSLALALVATAERRGDDGTPHAGEPAPGAGPWTRLALAPLDDAELLAIAADGWAAGPLPPTLAHLVLVHARGVPAAGRAIVAALVALGVLAPGDGAWALALELLPEALPRALEAWINLRVGALPPRTRALVRVAAVLGGPVERSLVEAVVRLDGEAEEAWRSALEDGVLRALDDARVELADATIEAALAESFSPHERARLHARGGHALAARRAPDAAPWLRAARHFTRADALGEAAAAMIEGARLSPGGGASIWRDALALFRAAHARGDADVDAYARALADATPRLARDLRAGPAPLEATLAALRADAHALTPGPEAGAALARAEAELLVDLGRAEEAALRLAPWRARLDAEAEAFAPTTRVALLSTLARALEELGRLGEATATLDAAATALEAGVEPEVAWRPLNALARLSLRLGDAARATTLLDAAAAVAPPSAQATLATNRAACARLVGALDVADAWLDEAERHGLELGDAVAVARARLNRAHLAHARRDRAAVDAALRGARTLADAIGWSEGVALADAVAGALGLGGPSAAPR
jgi:hypothetical protein